MTPTNALEKLQACGIKPSAQRIAIMGYLQANRTHPTADDVYVALSRKLPTLSKTTVYNTLHLFAEQGAVLQLTIDQRNVCFDACVEPHAHFLCRKCGKLYDVPIAEMATKAATTNVCGHKIEETHYYYRGVCCSCLQHQQEEIENK